MALDKLLKQELNAINIGLKSFQDTFDSFHAPSVSLEWKPPVDVSMEAAGIIKENRAVIEEANKEALAKILAAKPLLIDMAQAKDVIPGMRKTLFLHAGPPVTWERMCGPMKGAVIGAIIYEGLAKTANQAQLLIKSGLIEFAPCHEHSSVGPMAGLISYSMPVFIVKNETYGNVAYCTMNEGLGKVLRYGAYGREVVKRLKWMERVLYPVLRDAVKYAGPIDLKNLIAQALHMGDEVHNRNRAGTSLFYRAVAPAIVKTCSAKKKTIDVLNFINGNDHFFLNLSMAASKAGLDAARNIPGSSVAVVMARNGTDFGVQLAGTGGTWFTGPAEVPDALYFAGFSKADANPDIGDSAITETNGLGGFAIASSPSIVQFVGGKPDDALNYTKQMYEITAGDNNVYQVPYLNFRGTPTGIDVIKVVEKGIFPFIDTGVAHKEPGIGQVGAGVLSAPSLPFKNAFEGLAQTFKQQ